MKIYRIKALLQLIEFGGILFLCYAIGKFAADMLDVFFLDYGVAEEGAIVELSTTADKTIQQENYRDLILNNLFETEQAPEGIFAAEAEGQNSVLKDVNLIAVILWLNKPIVVVNYLNKNYTISLDKEVPGSDIKLVEVDNKRAKLSSAGSSQWFEIKKGDVVQTAKASSKPTETTARSAPPSAGIKLLPKSGNRQEVLVSEKRLEKELQNFAQFLNQARVFPYFENGKPAGYTIKNIDKDSIYEQLGLRNNDIIKTINGRIIDSPERAFEFFKLLRNEKLIRLSLVRGGSPIDFEFHVN